VEPSPTSGHGLPVNALDAPIYSRTHTNNQEYELELQYRRLQNAKVDETTVSINCFSTLEADGWLTASTSGINQGQDGLNFLADGNHSHQAHSATGADIPFYTPHAQFEAANQSSTPDFSFPWLKFPSPTSVYMPDVPVNAANFFDDNYSLLPLETSPYLYLPYSQSSSHDSPAQLFGYAPPYTLQPSEPSTGLNLGVGQINFDDWLTSDPLPLSGGEPQREQLVGGSQQAQHPTSGGSQYDSGDMDSYRRALNMGATYYD